MACPVLGQTPQESQSQFSGEWVTFICCDMLSIHFPSLMNVIGKAHFFGIADNSLMVNSDNVDDEVHTCIKNQCSNPSKKVALSALDKYVLCRTVDLCTFWIVTTSKYRAANVLDFFSQVEQQDQMEVTSLLIHLPQMTKVQGMIHLELRLRILSCC